MMIKDIVFAGIGLLVSISLAISINPNLEAEFLNFFGW
jgi:hypothetical protein